MAAKTVSDWINTFTEWPASVDQVRLGEKCYEKTVRNWARTHGIRTIGTGKRSQYLFFRQDVIDFRLRPRPGRRWPSKQ